MTRGTYSVLYVEDYTKDLETYSALLQETGLLEVQPLRPPPDLTRVRPEEFRADLFLIDYELTRAPPKGMPASYRGGTFANFLREAFSEHPIVLLTRPGLLKQYGGARRQLGSIDDVIFKHQIDDNPKGAALSLVCLIDGFRQLRRFQERTWESLVALIGAKGDEEEVVREAGPPFEPLKGFEEGVTSEEDYGKWHVAELAEWVRRSFLEYPGIVYDELYAAASLGISEESFRSSAIQHIFEDALYRGVFGDCFRRWWRGRLHSIAYSIIRQADLEPPVAESFSTALEKAHGISAEPSLCVWSGQPSAEAVCYILKTAVRREFALDYFPDDRPAVMDTAVVSFRAIQEDNRVLDEMFTGVAREMLAGIRSMERTGNG